MSVTITAASAAIEESVWLIEINPDPQGVGDPRPPQLFMPSGTPMGALNTQGSSVATAPTIVASDRGWVQEPGDTGTIAVYPLVCSNPLRSNGLSLSTPEKAGALK